MAVCNRAVCTFAVPQPRPVPLTHPPTHPPTCWGRRWGCTLILRQTAAKSAATAACRCVRRPYHAYRLPLFTCTGKEGEGSSSRY